MNKAAIQEAFPPGIVGREIVLAQMCHHYRRISTAKARVDTNLFKPPKISLSRPLSAEVASIVQRNLSSRSPPKHRRCLKYEQDLGEQPIKPSIRSQSAESRLRSTPEVYHPAVKSLKTSNHEYEGQQQATQTSLENSLAEEAHPKMKDEAVQTTNRSLYRPLDSQSVQFLRDVTSEALKRRAFTSLALNRIFLDHQCRNAYSMSQELMERELEVLRRQLGMLPRCQSNYSTVSDADALDALDALTLDPRIKEQVIISLRLSRSHDVKKPTYTYFDRLKDDDGDDEQQPTKDTVSAASTTTAITPADIMKSAGEVIDPTRMSIQHEATTVNSIMESKTEAEISLNEQDTYGGGWDAEIHEEDREVTTASSSKFEEESADKGSDEEDDASEKESGEEVEEDVEKGSDEEIEEHVDRESGVEDEGEDVSKGRSGADEELEDVDKESSAEKEPEVDNESPAEEEEVASIEDSDDESVEIQTGSHSSSEDEIHTASDDEEGTSTKTIVEDKTDVESSMKELSS